MSKSRSTKETPIFIPRKIVSGGQTGVDRGGLDAAIALGIQHGGWCPKGRLAEDGSVPSRYELVETDTSDYPERTQRNIEDSDATLILYETKLKGGTLLTRKLCKRIDKPHLCLRLGRDAPGLAQQWLASAKPNILNIAGPRESNSDGISERTLAFLLAVFAVERTD